MRCAPLDLDSLVLVLENHYDTRNELKVVSVKASSLLKQFDGSLKALTTNVYKSFCLQK